MAKEKLLSAREVAEQTGVTVRQLDYWVSRGIVPEARGRTSPGSGMRRAFNLEVVPKVRTLMYVQAGFENSLSCRILKGVYDNWEAGRVRLNANTWIVWT